MGFRVGAVLLTFWCQIVSGLTWVREGSQPDTFQVSPDAIEISGRASHPHWLRSDGEYHAFTLTFEYRLAQWAEAAVVVRAPKWGRPMRAGVALTLAHDFHQKKHPYVTGAISGRAEPRRLLPPSFDTWHKVELIVRPQSLTAFIDGELIQDYPFPRHTLDAGHIVFPDLGHRYSIRHLKLTPTGQSPRWEPLAGWKQRGATGSFTIEPDTITARDGHSILYAAAPARDFLLSVYVRSHQRVNSGIFLRGSPDEKLPRGFEVQIYSPPDAVYPTGSIYNVVRSNVSVDYEERWFLLQILVQDRRCLVWLDGDLVAETGQLPANTPAEGQIGLQIHSDHASVDFHRPRLMRIAATAPP